MHNGRDGHELLGLNSGGKLWVGGMERLMKPADLIQHNISGLFKYCQEHILWGELAGDHKLTAEKCLWFLEQFRPLEYSMVRGFQVACQKFDESSARINCLSLRQDMENQLKNARILARLYENVLDSMRGSPMERAKPDALMYQLCCYLIQDLTAESSATIVSGLSPLIVIAATPAAQIEERWNGLCSGWGIDATYGRRWVDIKVKIGKEARGCIPGSCYSTINNLIQGEGQFSQEHVMVATSEANHILQLFKEALGSILPRYLIR